MNVKKIILLLVLILFTAANVEASGLNYDTLATTATKKNPASLSLIKKKNDGSLFLTAVDTEKNLVSLIPFNRKYYDFYLNKGEYGDYPPLIFFMMFLNQERGQVDDNLGEWQGKMHVVPIYALFTVEGGQIICDKPFYSSDNLQSTHYHSTIHNPDYERLIEIYMTHMPRLHKIIESKGIVLP